MGFAAENAPEVDGHPEADGSFSLLIARSPIDRTPSRTSIDFPPGQSVSQSVGCVYVASKLFAPRQL